MRGIFSGGIDGTPGTNRIDYITIATLGDGTDFGDLNNARWDAAGSSNATRGIFAGGYIGNNIQYITGFSIFYSISTRFLCCAKQTARFPKKFNQVDPDQAQIVKRLKLLRGCNAALNEEVIVIFMAVYLFAI